MNTKTVTINIDWLEKIDGLTVSDAIAYLQTLDQNYRLSYCLEGGDTHGVNIASNVCYEVAMTDKEIFEQTAKRCNKEIARYTESKQYYFKRGQFDMLAMCDKKITFYKTILSDAKLNMANKSC